MFIREVEPNDAIEILDIYAPFVSESMVTFETDVPTLSAFKNRINDYKKHLPWLVAVEDDSVIGYAYASRYRERIAYQWVMEVSIYMRNHSKGKGIAKKLYSALFEILKLQGIHKVYAVIALPNDESVGFHEKMGFKWFATYKNVGNKFGKWCDVGWWEYDLLPSHENPAMPIAYPDLDAKKIKEILRKNSNL